MATRKSKWLGILAIVSSLLLSSAASAQQVDWPTMKANNMRAGVNGDAGPGVGNLRWWIPNSTTSSYTTSLVIDNTDFLNSSYDKYLYPTTGANPAGIFSLSGGAWYPDPLDPLTGGLANVDAGAPWLEYDPTGTQNEREPAYVYAACTPSTRNASPTYGATAAATWKFTPASANLYALYVWIPTGPQIVATGAGINGETFPQEFYVYQITASGRTFTDVVDTYISGGGWVRLGNGGAPTNMAFPYDGINSLTITLFNTIPRDNSGNLTGTTSNVVYADAAEAVPAYGAYDASPVSAQLIPGTSTSTRTISAVNQFSSGGIGNVFTTIVTGVVTSSQFDTGAPAWTYSPVQAGVTPALVDVAPADASPALTWTADPTLPIGGANAAETTPTVAWDPTKVNASTGEIPYTASVVYAPTLNTGTYQIFAYIPGNDATHKFAGGAQYVIVEGTTRTPVAVNQSAAGGWVQVGTRRYTNIAATPTSSGFPLKVYLTNVSNDPNNSGNTQDTGDLVYADAIKFVGEQSQSISSTPVIATVNITGKGMTQVVIVGDENGVLHCLDAAGNADGTTTEYWSYPSTVPTGGTDPNAQLDVDAEMPSGFNLSSALVTPLLFSNGTSTTIKYYLYVGTTNGRVYCIDTAGRGDYVASNHTVGSTQRIWTYPPTPATPNSNWGSFRGSLSTNLDPVAGTAAIGVPTIYVPTTQGRIYALDPYGTPLTTSSGTGTTTELWQFPLKTERTLGAIWTTPTYAVFNGTPYLYFGTAINYQTDDNGAFFCLNVSNANTVKKPVWAYAGGPLTSLLYSTAGNPSTTNVATGNFLSSPAVVTQSTVNAAYSSNNGFVYAVNDNNYVYVFDALTGIVNNPPLLQSGVPAQPWMNTNELAVGSIGATSYTPMTVYNNSGLLTPNVPIIMIPTLDGRFDGLFADPAAANQFNTRRAWEYVSASTEIASSLAISNNWMYGTDESGFEYAFNNGTGSISGGTPPGSQTIVENNPAGGIFRHAQVMLVTQTGYNRLRQPTGQNLDYYTATSATNNPYAFTRSPLAFEWGESAYIMVYNFPYIISNGSATVAPPIVNVTFSSQGKNVTRQAEARLFTEPPNAPDDVDDPNYPNGTERDNAYAILQVPLGSGSTALVPGPGTISVSISTSALNTYGAQQTVALNPLNSTIPYFIANPLGIGMLPIGPAPATDQVEIGYTTSPSDPEALVNGSPAIPKDTGHATPKLTNMLGTSAGVAQHGSSITTTVYPFDRSMMASLQPPGSPGLGLVRMSIQNLSWQGGQAAITKPLNSTYYANFEDYPVNFPNNSIDYPDIQSQQIQVVSNPNGTSQNPLYGNGVSLNPPLVKDQTSGLPRAMQLGDDPSWRILEPTPFNITVNVPRFQPPNSTGMVSYAGSAVTDSTSNLLAYQGYLGRMRVYVDSNTNHQLDISPPEAYRGFNFANSVDVDEKLTVSTPTVALGTLGVGTGYNPLPPGSASGTQGYSNNSNNTNAAGIFEPWAGAYSGLFQPVVVNNEGNVNLLNVRLAKESALNGALLPWSIYSSSNDILGWLDGSTDVWSDIDAVFAPEAAPATGFNQFMIQKPRVGDAAPAQGTGNPVARANPNTGKTGYFIPSGGTVQLPDVANKTLVNGTLKYPPVAPRVAVSIPFGMPSGPYQQTMRFIEKGTIGAPTWNSAYNEIWQTFNNAPETYSDPTFSINFNVRESQLTTSFTPHTAPMIDNGNPASVANLYAYSNTQPAAIRDPFGSLILAWSSDRPSFTPSQPTAVSQLGNYSLYMATVNNTAGFGNTGVTNTLDALSPLGDLNMFSPVSPSQWFRQAVAAYPSQSPNILFGTQGGESIISGTVQYGNPSFPVGGLVNPFNPPQLFTGTFMAFTGNAQKQTSSGRLGESMVFITTVQPSAGGNIGTPPQPFALTADPLVTKGKPSVLQTPTGALVFYPGTTGNQSNVYYSYFNGTAFGPSVALPFGAGFQSVTGVSVTGRQYVGDGEPILASGTNIAELTFTGQMRGRSNPEVFLGRMRLGANYTVVDDSGDPIDTAATDGNAFLDLPTQTGEILVAGSQPGQYRSLGVLWDSTGTINISQSLNGVTTPLLVAGSAIYDRETGIVSCDSNLGGKVYIDTTQGTVRFASSIPNQSAQIVATYTPRFLRISAPGGAGYAKPTVMFDHREISNPFYWRRANGNAADYTDDIKNDRYLFVYNRAAGGAGTPPRPYMTSVRFGVQLPFRVAVDANGNPLAVKVVGQRGPYQIDPGNGRLYFTGIDEDGVVTVSYTALSESGVTQNVLVPYQMKVGPIPESSEQQILIDNAVNEADVTAFLDPFSYFQASSRRPPLTWLFWSSTRSGVPDIYFQTISPQWPSIPISQ